MNARCLILLLGLVTALAGCRARPAGDAQSDLLLGELQYREDQLYEVLDQYEMKVAELDAANEEIDRLRHKMANGADLSKPPWLDTPDVQIPEVPSGTLRTDDPDSPAGDATPGPRPQAEPAEPVEPDEVDRGYLDPAELPELPPASAGRWTPATGPRTARRGNGDG